jgi:hypothetical protein
MPTINLDMPQWLKVMLWIAAFLAAAKTIYTHLEIRRAVRGISNELSRNGGDTVKDIVTRAAADSKKAAEDSRKALDLSVSLDRRMRRHGKRLTIATRKQVEFEQRMKDLYEKFARYVVHEAKNDLHASRLFEEEKRVVEKLENEQGRQP